MSSINDEPYERLEHYQERLPVTGTDLLPDVEKAAECIHNHLFDPRLTVGWMKQKCRINGKSFSATFKLCTGMYPKSNILHHRIEAGKILLLKTDLSITDVGLTLGFSSHATFCKAFKRKTGQRPSEWRDRCDQ